MAEFKKEDLKPCMVVELRDGTFAMITEVQDGLALSYASGGWDYLKRFDENLLHNQGFCRTESQDIMKVYGFCLHGCDSSFMKKGKRELLWERKKEPEPIEMTMAEIEKELGHAVKIIKGGDTCG